MSSGPSDFTSYEGESALVHLDDVLRVYGQVYAEPPYLEGAEDRDFFATDWPRRVAQPGFRLVTAASGPTVVGFAFGHRLTEQTRWWSGAVEPLPRSLTKESDGRTFAVIELAVAAPWRRRGLARDLHTRLLAERGEQRVTLLVRPEASPAQRAYAAWGYRRVGRIRPGTGAPVYDAMLRDLPFGA